MSLGVLRGDRGRFQLFGKSLSFTWKRGTNFHCTGDTVNTAARLESTGEPRKIQLSTETAELLMAAGKEHWITKREEKIKAKGKGELEVCSVPWVSHDISPFADVLVEYQQSGRAEKFKRQE